MMNVGVDKVRLGVHVCILFFIKFVCEARLSLKRGKQTIELITTTNHCSIIKMFLQMAEENKNMQSIANESEKRADVEKTGLLDEDEHDD